MTERARLVASPLVLATARWRRGASAVSFHRFNADTYLSTLIVAEDKISQMLDDRSRPFRMLNGVA